MALETVVVRPQVKFDSDGNPIIPDPAPVPVTLTPIAIAPGNTTRSYGDGGDLDAADFTVYLKLGDADKIADDYEIQVRGRDCTARVQKWQSPRTGRGGLVVLCRSATGKGT